MLYRDDIPPRVSINEAIELAKRFGSQDSGAFINGVLDKIYRENPALSDRTESEAGKSSGPSRL